MYEENNGSFVLKVGEIQTHSLEAGEEDLAPQVLLNEKTAHLKEKHVPAQAWRSSFQHFDGTIYLAGKNKSTDGGRTVIRHDVAGLEKISILQSHYPVSDPSPEGSVLSRPGLFLALSGRLHFDSPGTYHVKTWRSKDNFKSILDGRAVVKVPPGPRPDVQQSGWFGLYVSRNIVEMPDGTLLASAQGNFDDDKIVPTSGSGKAETRYLGRSFVISSKDEGQTWDYLSTVAAPQSDDPVDEGMFEPTLALLDDGRLLYIMRTGHHRPLYACWSSDEGSTWTVPMYTGLERGCWPALVKLTDGRLALSYGVRFPPGWSHISPEGDHGRWTQPGAGLVKLAMSPDGTGERWVETTVGSGLGSCYSTLFETEPNIDSLVKTRFEAAPAI